METTAVFIKKARNYISKISLSFKIRFGLLDVPKIVPFIGYSNGEQTFISGEVLEDNGIAKPIEGQSRWQNVKAMLKRYFADEFAGVTVRIIFNGISQEVVTNKFGVFNSIFNHANHELPNDIWQTASFELTQKIHHQQKTGFVIGEIMVVKNKPQFGIISDIDDTILVSYATSKLMKFRLMFFNNAYTRMPFEGVSAFYQSLQRGTVPGIFNPLFYLSNSEWDLYDLLFEFVQFNRIPKGPLLLREMAVHVLRIWKMREYNKFHKLEKLRQLFSVYKDLQFILIGDSGQKDPEIYSQIIEEFPGRVLTVYIRDVGIKEKTIRIQTISKHVMQYYNTEMVLVKDTEAAAKHAINKGYIMPDEYQNIKTEKQKDVQKKNEPASVSV
jgi:phosphatidate phosphatase APP1